VTKLLDDVLCYGTAAAAAQAASHALLGRDPSLPRTWHELVARYAAGSGVVAATLTTYAIRRPEASAQDAALVHWGVLLACGAAVAGLHLVDYLNERRAARLLDAQYAEEDAGHVASPEARRPIPLPLSVRGRA
jgi:hypothetical protein